MLKRIRRTRLKATAGRDARFAIVASRYNARYVDAMVRAAKAQLSRAAVKQIEIIRVPGAYEIPVVAARLARTNCCDASDITHAELSPALHVLRSTLDAPLSAIICLGVILRGETVHAAHIGEAVSRALMEIQVRYEIPVIHEVLLLENEAQARKRCLDPRHNRGTEAAQTALAMASLLARL